MGLFVVVFAFNFQVVGCCFTFQINIPGSNLKDSEALGNADQEKGMRLEAGVDSGVDGARNQLGAKEMESAGGMLEGCH